jgi:hypothetical protein
MGELTQLLRAMRAGEREALGRWTGDIMNPEFLYSFFGSHYVARS